MHKFIQKSCALCGPLFAILFIVGWWFIAGFVPPHDPSLNASAVAEFYQSNTGLIRLGILTAMIGSALVLPFGAVIAVQMRRIEGTTTPILSYTEMMAASVTSVIFLISTVLWTAAAFRPERAAEIIYAYNDFGWILILMTFAPFVVQFVAIALAILLDQRDSPLFPRWLAYFNFWVALLAVPGGLITFFKSGPFAWNGILAFWLPVAVFVLWFFVMGPMLLKAIDREDAA